MVIEQIFGELKCRIHEKDNEIGKLRKQLAEVKQYRSNLELQNNNMRQSIAAKDKLVSEQQQSIKDLTDDLFVMSNFVR